MAKINPAIPKIIGSLYWFIKSFKRLPPYSCNWLLPFEHCVVLFYPWVISCVLVLLIIKRLISNIHFDFSWLPRISCSSCWISFINVSVFRYGQMCGSIGLWFWSWSYFLSHAPSHLVKQQIRHSAFSSEQILQSLFCLRRDVPSLLSVQMFVWPLDKR